MSPISGGLQAISSPGVLSSWCRFRAIAGPLTGVRPVKISYNFMDWAQGIILLTAAMSVARSQSVWKGAQGYSSIIGQGEDQSAYHTSLLGRVRLADL